MQVAEFLNFDREHFQGPKIDNPHDSFRCRGHNPAQISAAISAIFSPNSLIQETKIYAHWYFTRPITDVLNQRHPTFYHHGSG